MIAPSAPTPRIQLQRIAVFCGSSPGEAPVYAEAARALGQLMVRRGIGLVYGGGNVGLMGILADTVLEGDGEVIGVIPRSLVEKEVAHHDITRLEIVETMHERKRMLYDFADASIALPGGMGTLDELFEALTWNQLSYLDQPCGLLNVSGYWDPLVEMLDRMVGHGFLRLESRRLLQVDDSAERLLASLADSPKPKLKWVRDGSGPIK